MKISIITATLNRGNTISRALKSIKSQSHPNIQLVVIDGGSDDNSVELVKPFLGGDDVFISEPDDGIYDALNKGLEMADGEIIGFLHSDDLFFNDNVISMVANAFTDNSIDVVYGDACFFCQ